MRKELMIAAMMLMASAATLAQSTVYLTRPIGYDQ